MGVQVDQAGCDDLALEVADVGLGACRQLVADGGYLAARKGDIGHAVEVLRRVDDARAAQDQVMVCVSHVEPVV